MSVLGLCPQTLQEALYLLITRHARDLLAGQSQLLGVVSFPRGENCSEKEHGNSSSSFDYPWTRYQRMFLKGFKRFRASEGSMKLLVLRHSRREPSCPPPSRSTPTCVQATSPTLSNLLGNWIVLDKAGFQQLSFKNVPVEILHI